jgi:predicted enzyme related to lactoylglutathione lyase
MGQTYINPDHPILIQVMGMPTIVHFDLPADDPERAKKFYEKLFDWKFEKVPMPEPYYLVETKDLEGNPGIGGGMGKRGMPEQKISNYIGVPSVDEYIEKVKKLGGKIIMLRTAVSGWGYLAICVDTENNTFGLWEEDRNVK